MKPIVGGSRSRKPRPQQGPAGSGQDTDAAFDSETLDRLEKIEEIRIVTTTPDAKKHRATIWVVVVDGAVFVRSFTGPKGRWYQNILANPKADLEVEGKNIHVKAVPVRESTLIETVSRAYLQKYSGSPYAKDMVRPEVLPTTLRLIPD
jgi:hypothetical protein